MIGMYRIRIFRIRPEPDLPDFFVEYPAGVYRIIWPFMDFSVTKSFEPLCEKMFSEKIKETHLRLNLQTKTRLVSNLSQNAHKKAKSKTFSRIHRAGTCYISMLVPVR